MMASLIAYQDLHGITWNGSIRLNVYNNRQILIRALRTYYLNDNQQNHWHKLISHVFPKLLINRKIWKPSLAELEKLNSPLKWYKNCYPSRQNQVLYISIQRLIIEKLPLNRAARYITQLPKLPYNIAYNHAYQKRCGFNRYSIHLTALNRLVLQESLEQSQKLTNHIIMVHSKEIDSGMYQNGMAIQEMLDKIKTHSRLIRPNKTEAAILRTHMIMCYWGCIKSSKEGHPNPLVTMHVEAAFLALERMYVSQISSTSLLNLEKRAVLSRRTALSFSKYQ